MEVSAETLRGGAPRVPSPGPRPEPQASSPSRSTVQATVGTLPNVASHLLGCRWGPGAFHATSPSEEGTPHANHSPLPVKVT